ncbi:hypothetical protein LARV_03216 [Longilinea arvoryzae]|uniref:Uncharacterized protein n=1 Tax=Longilinea arvoryzae TaxID=360412 RepID=A0A0S7BLP5_9CHLR|nr:hypothetical protein [Longilinea arvoryzae]GAP15430.1 hypothetical protein LARV_03216 [Longilinea arvoryzae]
MKNPNSWRVLVGVLLVLVGALALLQTLTGFENTGVIWGALFAAAGIGFLYVVFQDRSRWWAAIPGIVLLGIGAAIILDSFAPNAAEWISGLIILGGISAAFFAVYALSPLNWWALIPAGVMATLALVSVLDNIHNFDSGWVFLGGMAATFAMVALLPERATGRKLTWAWYPATALAVIALIVLVSSFKVTSVVWAVLLIGGGLLLVWRAMKK